MERNGGSTPTDQTAVLTAGKVSGRAALGGAVVSLVQHATREIRVLAPHLEPAVFNSSAFTDVLSRFTTRHPRQQVCLLVEDAGRTLRDNGRLAHVLGRLSGRAELRTLDEQDRGTRELLMIIDRSAFLFAEDASQLAGVIGLNNAPETAKLVERFDSAWQRSEPVALKSLGL
jgi:hypothetical protein